MIDAEQLRALGWSDTLIGEVTRGADDLARVAEAVGAAVEGFQGHAVSSHTAYLVDLQPHAASGDLTVEMLAPRR